jgi:hypothetical protein
MVNRVKMVRDGRTGSRSRVALPALLVAFALLASVAVATASVTPLWPGADELPLPGNAATAAGERAAHTTAVACASQGSCVAAGTYGDSNSGGDQQAMTLTQTAGQWGGATELTLPSGAAGSAQHAALDALSCPSAGGCVAGGRYYDTHAAEQAMVASQSGGAWLPATIVALPSGADPTAGAQRAYISAVSCTGPGSCVAVGSYLDSGGDAQAMIVTETAGAWARASILTPPAPSSLDPSGTALDGISCTAAGYCVAVGSYVDGANHVQAMIATQSAGGSWGVGELTDLPSLANATPTYPDGATLDSVSCADASDCTAVGSYLSNANGLQAMAVSETSGVWGSAQMLALPGNATNSSSQTAVLATVACTSPGNCSAAGGYDDSNGSDDGQAMLATQSAGAWSAGSQLALPGGANGAPGAQDAELYGLGCASPGVCTAVGGYDDTNGSQDSQPMAVSSVAPLAITTSSLAPAFEDVGYVAQLSASGGAGSYTWSVSSGALPAGLTLNSATGVISGTPSSIGPVSFTVGVEDAGPPAQSASATLALNVGDPPAPNTLLGKTTVNKRHHRVTFSFSSSGETIRFECALVRAHASRHKHAPPVYHVCRSPKTYKHLVHGSYTFYVRAEGHGGNDPTPAVAHFKL